LSESKRNTLSRVSTTTKATKKIKKESENMEEESKSLETTIRANKAIAVNE
jgi:hypothetical protein